MDLVTALVVVCLFAAIFLLLRRSKTVSRRSSLLCLPPGPSGWTMLWDMIRLRHDHLRFQRMVPYGEISFCSLGSQKIVVLNSYRAIQEAFVGQAEIFSGRPSLAYFELVTRRSGIVFTDGPVWQEHRRFALRLLRDFGVGRRGAEVIVSEECAAIKDQLEANGPHEGVDCRKLFTAAVNNVIARLTFGERCGAEDPNFGRLARNVDDTTNFRLIDVVPFMFPFIIRIPPLLRLVEWLSQWRRKSEEMHDYIRQKIKEHEKQLRFQEISNLEPTNICDAFLVERDRQEALNPGEHTYTEWQLIRNMIELFLAGTDTTATSLTWATLLLSLNPKVQKQAQKEVLENIGRSRTPQMSDRPHMPYLCAVIDEVLRYSSQFASNVPHRPLVDTELLGYFIPANSVVQVNLYHLHHDPKLWERPEEFYPGHFLTAEGSYKPSKYLLPFSVGKRACLGESLARMEIFMVLATVLQNFDVKLEDPSADIDAIIKGKIGALRCPLPHNIIFRMLDD